MNMPALRLEHSSYSIKYVQGPDIRELWPKILPHIENLVDNDLTLSIDKIFDELFHCHALAWTIHEPKEKIVAVMITKNIEIRDVPLVEVTIIAGADFRGWIVQVMRTLERYAVQEGRAGLRALCRPGMGKWLRNQGWRTCHEIMEWKV